MTITKSVEEALSMTPDPTSSKRWAEFLVVPARTGMGHLGYKTASGSK